MSGVEINWHGPLKFNELESFEKNQPGCYVWLLENHGKNVVIYAGSTKKCLYRRNRDHLMNWIAGLYVTYWPDCNVLKLYENFLIQQSNKGTKQSGRMSPFTKYLIDLKDSSIYIPDLNINNYLSKIQSVKSNGLDFYDNAALKTKIILGTFENIDSRSIEPSLITFVESTLIYFVRNYYRRKLLNNHNQDIIEDRSHYGFIAHESRSQNKEIKISEVSLQKLVSLIN